MSDNIKAFMAAQQQQSELDTCRMKHAGLRNILWEIYLQLRDGDMDEALETLTEMFDE